ncbi:MAG: hypothetical protein JWQ97_2478 [Phenylobacterium sp.]|nr:hypothetical protein [Phenylobacterium sp.]
MAELARVVRLARRPASDVVAEDFEIAQVELPSLAEGQVLVRNTWMSLDPYMRLPLTGRPGVHAPAELGAVMTGAAVGVVEQSTAPALPVGSTVVSQRGWRDRFVAADSEVQPIDASAGQPSWHLGILGLIGLTAFAGIEEVLKPAAGETIFVSGAAGAVGSLACQLARRRGARVLGSAGSDEKVAWLVEELGVAAAVNYKRQDVGAFLHAQCPDGLDIYFDNVGGPTLDAVLSAMRTRGRIGLCGAISQYNHANYRAGPDDFFSIIEKGLTVIGINAGLWRPQSGRIMPQLSALLASGELVWKETVVEGLENAPRAFASLFHGENIGKLVVRLS